MDIKINKDVVVVFDLNDTLYSELDYLKSAYAAIALFLDPQECKLLYSKMLSMYRCNINVFDWLAAAYAIQASSLVELYRNHQPHIEPFEGVNEVFEAIKNKRGRIGIITDGRSLTQRAKIKSLGLMSYVDYMVISEEIGFEKPSLQNYRILESKLVATEYYYIADNFKKDFIAPHILGWKSIGLIDNGCNIHFQSHEFMTSQTMPQAVITNFKELCIL